MYEALNKPPMRINTPSALSIYIIVKFYNRFLYNQFRNKLKYYTRLQCNYMGEGKIPITVRVDDDLLKWVDELVETKKFSSRSHAVKLALYMLKQAESPELALKT